MRIALLAPLPPAQSGIADYAEQWRMAMLQHADVEVLTPFAAGGTVEAQLSRLAQQPWNGVDLVHAELGGGRAREFLALEQLHALRPGLPLTATVHDPERLIWRSPSLPSLLHWLERLPRPMPQAAALLYDQRTLARERAMASRLSALVTLTDTGARCLASRMRLAIQRVTAIPHGNAEFASAPLPPARPLRLLYFGFIYPGKGIEDLLAALGLAQQRHPELAGQLTLTLAGGSSPELAFGGHGDYISHLRQLANRLNVAAAIDWKLDLPAVELPALIQAHHAMVLPYRESRKLALLGQMRGTSGALSWASACGRGAIASDGRAFAEEVSHGNGAVYPQGDIEALAACIVHLATDHGLAGRWAAHAEQLGRQRQWRHVALRFRDLFARVIEEARHAA